MSLLLRPINWIVSHIEMTFYSAQYATWNVFGNPNWILLVCLFTRAYFSLNYLDYGSFSWRHTNLAYKQNYMQEHIYNFLLFLANYGHWFSSFNFCRDISFNPISGNLSSYRNLNMYVPSSYYWYCDLQLFNRLLQIAFCLSCSDMVCVVQ